MEPIAGLSPQINAAIAQSERDGGVYLKDVPVGSCVHVLTQNTHYVIEHPSDDGWFISGNARFCPAAVPTRISGSTWGGSMLKIGFIGIGMCLEFSVLGHGVIHTSTIQSVQVLP